MTPKQQEQLDKFRKFTRWMHDDAKEAMFCARANFLVAMSTFNYIETLGAFLIGYFQKDSNGNTRVDSRGRNLRTLTTDRFSVFLSYMGPEYQSLFRSHPELYDELRCGLTHEYLPKNRSFCIYGVDQRYSDTELDQLQNPETNSQVTCGINFLPHNQDGVWQIFVGKLLIDFERGAKKLVTEVESEQDSPLLANFFEAAAQMNLEKFS